jgi:selenide,water dikinase
LNKIPFYREASQMYLNGFTTRVNKINREMVEQHWSFPYGIKPEEQELLLDPQTSGGLLFAVPADQSSSVLSALKKAGVTTSKQVGFVSRFNKSKLIFS